MKVKDLCFCLQIQSVHFLLLHAYFRVVHAQAISQLEDTQYYKVGADLSRPMVVVVVVLLFIFFIMVLLSIYLRHHVQSRAAFRRATDVEHFRSCHGLDPAVIRTFPVVVHSAIKELKTDKVSLECAVCLSEFQDCETLRLIPKCDHIFHPNCIDAWLASRATCPVCRAKLTPDCHDKPTANSRQINTSGENSASELGEARDRARDHDNHVVMINIDEADRNRNRDDSEEAEIRNSLMTTIRTMKITGRFPRSHSTGHSLVQPEEDTEKYTLRLPEELKRQIIKSSGKLKRSASYDVVLCILETN